MRRPDDHASPDIDAVVADLTDDLPHMVPFKDAAMRLGVSTTTLRRWVSKGRLSVLKTASGACGKVLVPRREIGRLVRQRMTV